MKCALIEIAALSSERLPLNEGLLSSSDNHWPMALRLEDRRRHLSALGLIRVKNDSDQFWGLAHDILGRLLLNAVFHDFAMRTELGFGAARDAEHLRFMALKRIATKNAMAELQFRPLADQYATTIFKIDPDHGAQAFAGIWREALEALDEMPRLLRDTSRVFRHHTAISRRRIAALENPIYEVSGEDRIALLERAIEDIDYALNSIPRSPDDEPDLYLYNSLANAYLNLASILAQKGELERVDELRQKANEATRQAYNDNPTNPWVVETHIKNLLSISAAEPERAAESALEALLAVYEALRARDGLLRADQLSRLGESALDILFSTIPPAENFLEPRDAVEVLIATWRVLAGANIRHLDETLGDLDPLAADEALAILAHPAGRGDMQVLRLSYGILSAAKPFEFAKRLALLENLQATDQRLSPQLRLEYALLLYQVGRAAEADRRFRELRRVWRETEHFVSVPEPLHWLRDGEVEDLRTVQARVGSDQEARPMARVSEFGNLLAPFRPEEFDVRSMRPGLMFRAHVSFGHNGPFLRPPTAGPKRN
jgi:tetratricopeptide (TPR) repeat protein